MARRGRLFDKVKPPLIILYTVLAVIFNCWIISTFMLSAGRPTVLVGTVLSTEDQTPVYEAVVGIRLPESMPGSREVTTATDAEGRYRLEIAAAYEDYSVFCLYGSSSGVITNGPRRKTSDQLKEGESEFQIVLHRRNHVDWEVSTR